MVFTLIFGTIFVLGWSFCGLVPWLVGSVLSRGNAGLSTLLLCLFAANVAALAVPLLGADGMGGFLASFAVAMATSAGLLLVRKFALGEPATAQPLVQDSSTKQSPRL